MGPARRGRVTQGCLRLRRSWAIVAGVVGTLITLAWAPAAAGAQGLPAPGIPVSLGVNIHGGFLASPCDQGSTCAQEWNLLAQSGFTWVRTDLTWQAVQPNTGPPDFASSGYDALVQRLVTLHIRPILILDYCNTNFPSVATAAGRQAFANYAAAAASNFKGDGVVWEIWNEPDGSFWNCTGQTGGGIAHPQTYAALAEAAANAIHTADPTATVIAPAASTFATTWFQQLAQDGLLGVLNGFSVHGYGANTPEDIQPEWAQLHGFLQTNAVNGRALPMISSEWGFETLAPPLPPNYCCTDAVQADYLVRMMLDNIQAGVPVSIWYDFRDGGAPNSGNNTWGVVTNNLAPKPAYGAIQVLAKTLGGQSYASATDVASCGAGEHAIRLSGGGEAFWSTASGPHSGHFYAGSPTVSLVAQDGAVTSTVYATNGVLATTFHQAVTYVLGASGQVAPPAPTNLRVPSSLTELLQQYFARVPGGPISALGSPPGVGVVALLWHAQCGVGAYQVIAGVNAQGQGGTLLATVRHPIWVGPAPAAPTYYAVRAVSPAGVVGSPSAGLRVVPPAVVSSVSPATGPAAGGTPVTIGGNGFTNASAVDFGAGNPAPSFTVNGAGTAITTVSPPGTGTSYVSVVTPAGASAPSAASRFLYQGSLQVQVPIPFNAPIFLYPGQTSLQTVQANPCRHHNGATFGRHHAINALDAPIGNFTPPGAPVTFQFPPTVGNGALCVRMGTSTTISVPAGHYRHLYLLASGLNGPVLGTVTPVYRSGQGSARSVLVDDWTANSLTPGTSAGYDGGPRVTAASGALGNSIAHLWTLDAGSVNPTRTLTGLLVAMAPAGTPIPAGPGVPSGASAPPSAGGGQGYNGVAVAYIAAATLVSMPPPVVTAVTPGRGLAAGGTAVTVTGSGFTTATAVLFGGRDASSFTIRGDGQLIATAPAGAGVVDVQVETACGTAATADATSCGTSAAVPADRYAYVGLLSLRASAPVGVGLQGGSGLQSPGGLVVVDSTAPGALTVGGGSSVTALGIQVSGGVSQRGRSSVTPTPVTGYRPMADPLASLPPPAASGPSLVRTSVGAHASVTLGPGVYAGGIHIGSGAHVTLAPGTYVLFGGGLDIGSGARVTGGAVLVALVPGAGNQGAAQARCGALRVAAGATVDLGGLSDTAGAGSVNLAVYVDPACAGPSSGGQAASATLDRGAVTISGRGTLAVGGVIYAPADRITVSGGARLTAGGVVAGTVSLSGGGSALVG